MRLQLGALAQSAPAVGRTIASVGATILLASVAGAALADTCPTPGFCGPPSDPPVPVALGYIGTYHAGADDGFVNSDYQLQTSILATPVPIGPGGASFGAAGLQGTLETTLSPVAGVSATASADGVAAGYVQIYNAVIYRVRLTTSDPMALAAMNALADAGQALQQIDGHSSLTQAGAGYADATASSGDGIAGGQSASVERICAGGDLSGCGLQAFSLPVYFRNGSHFQGGAIEDFYSTVTLGVTAQVGSASLDASLGGSTAVLDPVLSLVAALQPYAANITLDLGQGNNVSNAPAGSVPEPSSWALSILGLAAVGGALRARRRAVAAV